MLLGSARRLRGAGVQAQGAGRIDLLAGAGVEVATQRAEVSFGRTPDRGWRRSQTITVRKGAVARIVIPCVPDVHIAAQQAFSPANVLHNQDPRTLAVQLKNVEQLH